ncbi:MAG: CPBP family intramembrane metalloprotease [Nitrospirae bacterium]|nr:CPBP family intramembrane metalloprotease [Candidatus Manganitrophaceae bacterium]
MAWWKLSFFLLVLLGVGFVFSFRRGSDPDRGTLFDRQRWSIWIGLFGAALPKSVSAIVLWTPWIFQSHPIVVPIYLLAEFSVFVAVLLFYRHMTAQPLADLGFSSERLGMRLLFGLRWILAAFLVIYATFYFLLRFQTLEVSQAWLLRLYRNQDVITGLMHFFEKMWGLPSLAIPILFMVVLRPFSEEMIFRGLLYGPIRRKSDPVMAALITSFLYMLADGSYTGHHLLSGVLAAYLYEQTESLFPGMILHGLINLGSVVYYFGGKDMMSVVVRKTEAGWIALLLTVVLVGLEVLYRVLLKRSRTPQAPVSTS